MPRTLQSKLVAFVVGLIASAVLLLGILFYQQLRGQLLEGVENEIRSAATAYSLAIGEWMAPKVQLLKAIKPVIGTAEAKSVFVLAKAAGGFDTVYAGYPDKRALFSETQNLPADWDQVRNRMVEISHGGGDLSVRLDVVSDDEIGQTATAFNAFLTQLQSMFSSLSSNAKNTQRLLEDFRG